MLLALLFSSVHSYGWPTKLSKISIPSTSGRISKIDPQKVYRVVLRFELWSSNYLALSGQEQMQKSWLVLDVDAEGRFEVPATIKKAPFFRIGPYWWAVRIDVLSAPEDWQPSIQDELDVNEMHGVKPTYNDVMAFKQYMMSGALVSQNLIDPEVEIEHVGYFTSNINVMNRPTNKDFVKTDVVPALKDIELKTCHDRF